MKFAIWGCRHGHIEEFIVQMLEKKHEFIGIYETEGTLGRQLAKKYKVKYYQNKELLFLEKPDIIGSSAINKEKSCILEECNKLGCHVMFDKPIVADVADYDRVKAIMEEDKIQVGMMLTERFNPAIVTLKHLIQDGELGKIIGFTILKPHRLMASQRDSWHFDKGKNGGLVVDLMVHDFDLLRWLTGSEVEQSIGYIQQGNVEGFENFLDDAKILVKMKNQITACLQTDWWTPNAYWTYGEGCIICTGTKGRCVVHTTGSQLLQRKSSFCVLTKDNKEEEILENRSNNLNVTDDFLNRIHGGVGMICHSDILKATKASLEADQTVTTINRLCPLCN